MVTDKGGYQSLDSVGSRSGCRDDTGGAKCQVGNITHQGAESYLGNITHHGGGAPSHSHEKKSPAITYLESLQSQSARSLAKLSLYDVVCVFEKWAYNCGDRGGSPAERWVLACGFAWHELRHADVVYLRSELLGAGYSLGGVRRRLYAVRGVLRSACRLGLMSADDLARALDVPPVRGESLPAGRALDEQELGLLFDGVFRHRRYAAAKSRDAALLGFFYGTGCRTSEVLGCRVEDYDWGSGEVHIRGKGSMDRIVWLVGTMKTAVDNWLRVYGVSSGPLFPAVTKGGAIRCGGGPLSRGAIVKILTRMAIESGVRHFSARDLRRTFATRLFDFGVDVLTVSHLLGHANPATTGRYDCRPARSKKEAVAFLDMPFLSSRAYRPHRMKCRRDMDAALRPTFG